MLKAVNHPPNAAMWAPAALTPKKCNLLTTEAVKISKGIAAEN